MESLRGGASVHSSSAEAHEAALDAAGRVTPVRLGGSGWFINPGGVPRAPRGVIGLFCTLLYFILLYFKNLRNLINLSLLHFTLLYFAGSVRPFPGHMHLAVCHEQ